MGMTAPITRRRLARLLGGTALTVLVATLPAEGIAQTHSGGGGGGGKGGAGGGHLTTGSHDTGHDTDHATGDDHAASDGKGKGPKYMGGRDGASGGHDSGEDHDHTDGDDHDSADGGHESGGGKGPNYMGGRAAGGRLDRGGGHSLEERVFSDAGG